MLQRQELWQGPIPRPEDFASYKEVDGGFPDRIMGMAERQLTLAETQQEHRLELEQVAVRGANFRANIGLFMAFAIALSVLGGSFWIIYEGHDAAGISIAGLDLVSLVGVFVYGRHDQAQQDETHRQTPDKPRRRG
jgi:uncharacterized membrane protein